MDLCSFFTYIFNVLTMNVTFCMLSKWSLLIYSSAVSHRWVCITLILTWRVGLYKDLSSPQRMEDERPEMSDDDGRGRLRASLTRTGWALRLVLRPSPFVYLRVICAASTQKQRREPLLSKASLCQAWQVTDPGVYKKRRTFMSHLQDAWLEWNDSSQILMSLLKLKLRPLYDITITLSVAGSAAVTQAQIVHFPFSLPPRPRLWRAEGVFIRRGWLCPRARPCAETGDTS